MIRFHGELSKENKKLFAGKIKKLKRQSKKLYRYVLFINYTFKNKNFKVAKNKMKARIYITILNSFERYIQNYSKLN